MTLQGQNTALQDRTVGEIAAKLPGATAVFRKFRVDFCCHGDIALGEAMRQRGIDAAALERELRTLDASDTAAPSFGETIPLIDHILTRYHDTHRREVPELIELARKVESVHRDHPQVPIGLARLLQEVRGDLESHMKKEELLLFPAMQQHPAGGLDAPIAQMRDDHVEHGEQLRQLEDVTGGFALPEDACRSWQALYSGARKFRDDLIEHIHLENNVLFPRFEDQ